MQMLIADANEVLSCTQPVHVGPIGRGKPMAAYGGAKVVHQLPGAPGGRA